MLSLFYLVVVVVVVVVVLLLHCSGEYLKNALSFSLKGATKCMLKPRKHGSFIWGGRGGDPTVDSASSGLKPDATDITQRQPLCFQPPSGNLKYSFCVHWIFWNFLTHLRQTLQCRWACRTWKLTCLWFNGFNSLVYYPAHFEIFYMDRTAVPPFAFGVD